jgi:hypothetical protein
VVDELCASLEATVTFELVVLSARGGGTTEDDASNGCAAEAVWFVADVFAASTPVEVMFVADVLLLAITEVVRAEGNADRAAAVEVLSIAELAAGSVPEVTGLEAAVVERAEEDGDS